MVKRAGLKIQSLSGFVGSKRIDGLGKQIRPLLEIPALRIRFDGLDKVSIHIRYLNKKQEIER